MTWKDINIKTFKKINKIIKDDTLTDVEKEISLISIISKSFKFLSLKKSISYTEIFTT